MRRRHFVAFREAAQELWGQDGYAALTRDLSEGCRARTAGAVVSTSEHLPVADAIEWFEVTYRAMCMQSHVRFRAFSARVIELGFGRVHRLILGVVGTRRLLERAPSLWRAEHTHGELQVSLGDDRSGVLVLRDHPYITSKASCLATAEMFRYLGVLSGARSVQDSHTVTHEALEIRVRWT